MQSYTPEEIKMFNLNEDDFSEPGTSGFHMTEDVLKELQNTKFETSTTIHGNQNTVEMFKDQLEKETDQPEFDVEAFKRNVLEKYERSLRGGSHRKPVHKHASNYTPPKNRKKNKKTTRKK
jgi:hypothetical protein